MQQDPGRVSGGLTGFRSTGVRLSFRAMDECDCKRCRLVLPDASPRPPDTHPFAGSSAVDGGIDAVALAARIIQDQLKLFINFEEPQQALAERVEDELPFNKNLLRKVDELDTDPHAESVRAFLARDPYTLKRSMAKALHDAAMAAK